MTKSFEEKLWNNYESEQLEETQLLYVYETLMDACNDAKFKECNDFIKLVIDKNTKDTNLLVHMLNILSTKKDKLDSWNKLKEYSYNIFITKYDEKTANTLLKVIM